MPRTLAQITALAAALEARDAEAAFTACAALAERVGVPAAVAVARALAADLPEEPGAPPRVVISYERGPARCV